METKNIRSLSAIDIDKKVDELKTQIFNLRIQKFTSGLEKPNELKDMKKTIAKLLTVKNEKKRQENINE
jgi:large subunit ribosomal protein L29